MAIFTHIISHRYNFHDSTGVNVGGFDWNLQFNWHGVPQRERDRHQVWSLTQLYSVKFFQSRLNSQSRLPMVILDGVLWYTWQCLCNYVIPEARRTPKVYLNVSL